MSTASPKSLTSFPVFADGRPVSGDRTVVCFGLARGGTSMVAGAILGLGVPMGRDLGRNLEDPAFNIDGQNETDDAFVQRARAAISERNAAHPIWGWKFPNATRYLEHLIPDLRAPHLVCVYRDPIPIAHRRWQEGESATEFVAARLRAQMRNTRLIETLGVPCLMVSYEKASSHPIAFIEELASFLNLPVPSHVNEIVDFMTPGSYKAPDKLLALLAGPD